MRFRPGSHPTLRKWTGLVWNDKYGLVILFGPVAFSLWWGKKWLELVSDVWNGFLFRLVMMVVHDFVVDLQRNEMMGGGCDGVAIIISVSVDLGCVLRCGVLAVALCTFTPSACAEAVTVTK